MMGRPPRTAAGAFGRVLAYLDRPTLAAWSGSSGLKLLLSRWYARLVGFPELAAHQRFRPVQDLLRRHAGDTVLDLGPGNGLYSIADAIDRPSSAHLLADLSVRHMRRANETGRALGLPVWGIACSAEALPFPSESVDTVLVIEVLQFVDNDEAAINELARVLRPGGVWVCEQENPPPGAALEWTAEARLRRRRTGYTPEALKELAAGAGLELEQSRMVSGRIGRRWESFDGRLFRKSRGLHFLLFPIVRLLAWLSTPAPVGGEPGTVLYLFRKLGGGAPSRPRRPLPS
jgi:SAM-dependent methyltransferase